MRPRQVTSKGLQGSITEMTTGFLDLLLSVSVPTMEYN